MTDRLDAAGATDLTPELRTITGRRVTAERVLRRLQTLRGALWYAPDFGTSLVALLNAAVPPASIAAATQAEVLKDEEVLDADVDVVRTGSDLSVTITLTDADGPFVLRVAVSSVSVALLESPS